MGPDAIHRRIGRGKGNDPKPWLPKDKLSEELATDVGIDIGLALDISIRSPDRGKKSIAVSVLIIRCLDLLSSGIGGGAVFQGLSSN